MGVWWAEWHKIFVKKIVSSEFEFGETIWWTTPLMVDNISGICTVSGNWISSKSSPAFKGQLISECSFDVLNYPKNQQKIWQISALESKKWIMYSIIRKCLYFVDFTTL